MVGVAFSLPVYESWELRLLIDKIIYKNYVCNIYIYIFFFVWDSDGALSISHITTSEYYILLIE